jgi:hypothetical protein
MTSRSPSPSKVVHRRAAGAIAAVDAETRGSVLEPSDVELRLESLRRDPEQGGNTVWIAAQRHVSEIEEPDALQLPGVHGECLAQQVRGRLGTLAIGVPSGVPQGKDAALTAALAHAVGLLGATEVGHGQLLDELHAAPRIGVRRALVGIEQAGQHRHRLAHLTLAKHVVRERRVDVPDRFRRGVGGKLEPFGLQPRDPELSIEAVHAVAELAVDHDKLFPLGRVRRARCSGSCSVASVHEGERRQARDEPESGHSGSSTKVRPRHEQAPCQGQREPRNARRCLSGTNAGLECSSRT